MSPALTTLPPATKAEIIRKVLRMKHPKLEKPSLASNYHLTLPELHALLNHHGYPDRDVMARHAQRLTEEAEAEDTEHGTAPEVERETPTESEADGDFPPIGAALGQLVRVKCDRLFTDPNNPRDELRDIEDLAESIAEAGLLQPILARTEGQRLIVVAGHRRLAAVRSLRWDTVPTIVRPSMRADHIIAAMLIENNQRADLDPIEEARGLLRLKLTSDCSDQDLARKIGRSQAFVSNRLQLLSLTPEQQAEVRAGNMTLIEATHRGRINSGKVGKTGQDKNWHLGPQHPLAAQVKARCQKLGHPRGRTVGGMGCGSCWDHVIRTDERVQLVEGSIRKGTCDTCGSLTTPSPAVAP